MIAKYPEKFTTKGALNDPAIPNMGSLYPESADQRKFK
jgi:hypothetical protein